MSKDLLLEIGLEEMPARFVTATIEQLSRKVETWLSDKKIQHGVIEMYSTPRRLALVITDVAEAQQDIQEEAKGPALKIAKDENGNWSKAAIGFSKGHGMSVDDLFFKEINGVQYAHVEKFIKGQHTDTLLPELKDIISNLNFPKNMRWGNEELKYIRPIKWLIALYGTEVIPFDIAGVTTDKTTYGHRFLGGEVEITSPKQYKETLLAQYVIVDAQERKSAIRSQLKKIEEEKNWVIPVDEELLEEVNNLVEYPTALFGRFEEAFLELPEEVLITSMKEHQRYFPVKDEQSRLLPFFVTVRNGDHNHLDTVARGNEKVLRARLADADFFYKEDQKIQIKDALEKLKSIVYHEDIGTLAEKVNRVIALTQRITDELNFSVEEKNLTKRSAEICKFDLVSKMVYEFPELQGLMGEKYAIQKGEDKRVAAAVNEHYMPRNADDKPAPSRPGAALAISEKLDTIASTFAIGLIPSGSQDPYALRRQASGIVQTLIQHKWDLELEVLIEISVELIEKAGFAKMSASELKKELLAFFKLRLKHNLQEKGIRYDVIDAILFGSIGSVAALIRKAEALQSKLNEATFKESMEALSRVVNISSKAEEIVAIQEGLFENDAEKKLYLHMIMLEKTFSTPTTEEQYFEGLISLREDIKAYFDNTMVMVDNLELRHNRLSMLARLSSMITSFANVTEIMVK